VVTQQDSQFHVMLISTTLGPSVVLMSIT